MSDPTLIIEALEINKLIIQVDHHELSMGIACPVGIGEANAGANAGAGARVFRDLTGGALIFRTLAGVGGVNINENGDEVEFQTHVSSALDPLITDDTYVVGTLWTNTVTGESFLCIDATPGAAVWNSFSGGSWQKDSFTSLPGQVTFILSQAPTDANSIVLDVNGAAYEGGGIDYTVSGTTVTWLNTPFALELGDRIVIRYR